MARILIVEDVPALSEQYAYDLHRLGGHEAVAVSGGGEAIAFLEKEIVDCMILDLEMPGVDGFEVLKTLEERRIEIPVIVYTGTGNYERCVRAVKLGAYSFIDKAEPIERVVREVENALEKSRLVHEVEELRDQLGGSTTLLGKSRIMVALRRSIEKVAPVPSTVLITGESGSGKELVARELHRLSGRKGIFLAVNSAALPESLVESELFGHEKGAFTGADRIRRGAFESATGGTLFLDEIGELPPAAQAKLLRVLEQDTVMRLGGKQPIRIDTRVVAATNRDLSVEIEGGRFRQDLYYRLNVHALPVPSLRERLSDVPLLAAHFLATLSKRMGMARKEIEPEAIKLLERYDWRRNNVRELRNMIERMMIASEGKVIEAGDVPVEVLSTGTGGRNAPAPGTLSALRGAAEREIVLKALDRNDWHITKTAANLGLADHSSLLKIMKRHGIKRPRRGN